MNSKKIAVLAVTNATGEQGGAEKFYQGLITALCEAGVQAELLDIPVDESSFETIKEAYLRFYDLNLSGYDGVISTKAPSYLIRHHNHICFLLHTIRVFYDMFDDAFPDPTQQIMEQRKLIQKIDAGTLCYPHTKKVFAIGHEVRNRLLKFINIDTEVIHPALAEEIFKCGNYDDYLFMPGRVHRWKRIELIIKAMQSIKAPLKLKISGTGEDEAYYRNMALKDKRIEFLGRVSDKELVRLYSNALAVPFVPIREDYGYITIEAFRSGKPVITCADSGEPVHFVHDGENGFICPPDPEQLALKMEFFYNNKDKAREMGMQGEMSARDLTWPAITAKLLDALGISR